MKKFLQIISSLALVATVGTPCLFYASKLDLAQNKMWMLIASIIWFCSASFWIGSGHEKSKAT